MSVISCPSCSGPLDTQGSHLAGQRIRCGACKHVFTVPANDLEQLDDLEEVDDSETEAIQPARKRPLGQVVPPPLPDQRVEPQTDASESDEDYSLPPHMRRRSRRHDDSYDDDEDERPKKKARVKPKKKKSIQRSRSDQPWLPVSISTGILTGLLMMVGSVIWFVVGLAAGRIFFYPPVMFVLGVAAVVRGLFGHEE